jgi:hypothetical protein
MKLKLGILAVLMIFIFAACGGSSEENITAYEHDNDGNFGGSFGTGEILHDTGHVYVFDDPLAALTYETHNEDVWSDREPFDPQFTSLEHLNRGIAYFAEMNELFDEEGGELWGFPLHVPVMLVDAETGSIVANRPDYYGNLIPMGGVYVGSFPPYIVIVDHATRIDEIWGVRWAVITWGVLFDRPEARRTLFAREAFHWHQYDMFGNRTEWSMNEHLREVEARISVRLEINALLRAANANDEATRLSSIAHALSFRNDRRHNFGGTARGENMGEIWNGLAFYTEEAITAVNRNEIVSGISRFAGIIQGDSLQFSFGTVTGALYAFLLDEMNIHWKEDLNARTDLGLVLEDALGLTLFNPNEIDKRRYDYTAVRMQETAWAETADEIYREVLAILETATFLIVPRGSATVVRSDAYNRTSSHTLPGNLRLTRGNIEMHGSFGVLEMPRGDIISVRGVQKIIAENMQINGNEVTAATWSLTLNEGYGIVSYREHYQVVR